MWVQDTDPIDVTGRSGRGQLKVDPADLPSWGLLSPGYMFPVSLSFQMLKVGMTPSFVLVLKIPQGYHYLLASPPFSSDTSDVPCSVSATQLSHSPSGSSGSPSLRMSLLSYSPCLCFPEQPLTIYPSPPLIGEVRRTDCS